MKISPQITASIPNKVGDYKFVKVVVNGKGNSHYKYAIYRNKSVLGFAKVWEGRLKNQYYKYLKHEIEVYETLNRSVQENSTNKYDYRFKIPALLVKEETKAYLIAIFEYIPGVTIAGKSASEKYKISLYAEEFIKDLGNKLSVEDKKKISSRKPEIISLIYPYFLILALINTPDASSYLLKGAAVFSKGLPRVLRKRKLKLTHRDLHDDNIVEYKKNMYIVDLSFATFTFPEYELVSLLGNNWISDDLRAKFLDALNKETKDEVYTKALMVNFATQCLTGKDMRKEKKDSYISYLKYAIQ